MRQTLVSGPRILSLIGAIALLSAPALARDVTVYGGGTSKTFTTTTDDGPRVIAYGQERQTVMAKRTQRFDLERKVQAILETRDSEDSRETSDAMMRIILRGNRDARRQYVSQYPYSARSAAFYARLKQAMREQEAGIRVYRQSVLDDVSSEDLQRVAKALNAIK